MYGEMMGRQEGMGKVVRPLKLRPRGHSLNRGANDPRRDLTGVRLPHEPPVGPVLRKMEEGRRRRMEDL